MALTETGNMAQASSGGATSLTTASKTYVAGNLITVTCNAQSATPPTITDSNGGNTWAQVGTTVHPSGSANYLSVFRAYGVVGASYTITATWGGSTAYVSLTAREFHDSAGSWSTNPDDGSAVGNGSGTAPTSGTVTVSGSEGIIVFVAECDGANLTNGPNGYTTTSMQAYLGEGYKIVTASEAVVVACGSGVWEILAKSFKGASGGAAFKARQGLTLEQAVNRAGTY